jgi:hypothetical protein
MMRSTNARRRSLAEELEGAASLSAEIMSGVSVDQTDVNLT